MADIKVNTQKIHDVASKIDGYNKAVNDAITNLDRAMSTLDYNWNSDAGNQANNRYAALKRNYCQARSTVVANFTSYLRNVAEAGFIEAETENTRLADQFK